MGSNDAAVGSAISGAERVQMPVPATALAISEGIYLGDENCHYRLLLYLREEE